MHQRHFGLIAVEPWRVEATFAEQFNGLPKVTDSSVYVRVNLEPPSVAHGSTNAVGAIRSMKAAVHQAFGCTSDFKRRRRQALSTKSSARPRRASSKSTKMSMSLS